MTSSDASVPAVPPVPKKITKEYLAAVAKVPLAAVAPDIVRLAKDQYGCRFLQKKIDDQLVPSYSQRLYNFDVIFEAVFGQLYELIIDPFGNYLVQKLVMYCRDPHLNQVLEQLQYNLFQISINQHGTRALQKIIDACHHRPQLAVLTRGLSPYIIELIKDLNGNHVIQKILNKFSPQDCQFIYDAIVGDLSVVATHKHGCCVLQKCLNHVTTPQLHQFSQAILSEENFASLINDQFGNYVVQYLISINSIEISLAMFANFVSFGVTPLCTLKFSSNVVEKFLKNCYTNEVLTPQYSSLKFELIYHILVYDLNKLINDPYGNYVVQTLIDIVVNPHIVYLSQGQFCIDKLTLLLPQGFLMEEDTLQIAVIKTWFQKCKIISSFGKRIQSKINIILNNQSRPRGVAVRSVSASSHPMTPSGWQHPGWPINMTANGEFVTSDYTLPPSRSLSVSSSVADHELMSLMPITYDQATTPQGHARQVSMASSSDNTPSGHRSQSSISSLSGMAASGSAYTSNPLASNYLGLNQTPTPSPWHHPSGPSPQQHPLMSQMPLPSLLPQQSLSSHPSPALGLASGFSSPGGPPLGYHRHSQSFDNPASALFQ